MNKTLFGPIAAGLISAGTFLGVRHLIKKENDREVSPETAAPEREALPGEETSLPEIQQPTEEPTIGEKKKIPKFCRVTAANDIRYRGPLSYRSLKILGWLLIVLTAVGSMYAMLAKVQGTDDDLPWAVDIMQRCSGWGIPLLLIAAFATVLNGRENYAKVIGINALIATGLTAGFYIIYERYFITGAAAFIGSQSKAREYMAEVLRGNDTKGYFAFNIFIDFTLCALVMFFVNYDPKRFFKGRKIYLFRALIFLPMSYELVSICIKILASTHSIALSPYVFPFLTTKPPVSFLLFYSIARYFKVTEMRFTKYGKTHADYEAYLKTNHNSFRFSRYLVIRILIFAAIDLILLILITALHYITMGYPKVFDQDKALLAALTVYSWGFGATIEMLPIAPMLLLFSYTRTHKNMLVDLAVPLAGVVGVVIVYADGIFKVICEYIKAGTAT